MNQEHAEEIHDFNRIREDINEEDNTKQANDINQRNVMGRRTDSTIPLSTVDTNNRIPRRFERSVANLMLKDDCKRHRNYYTDVRTYVGWFEKRT